MINIVLVADCIANLTGGAEKQIYELAKRLDKNKYNVTVISLDCLGQASGEWFTSVGCQYYRFRVVRIYGLSGFIQGIRFYKFLKSNQIDIIQTYHFSSDIWGTFWGKLAGVPVIISNRRDMGFWRKSWHIYAYRWVNRWVSKIIVVSNSIRDMVISTEGVPQEKIEVIYNGVDLPVNPAAPSLAELKNYLVIMHVASLSPVKGHIFLLEALKKIIEQFKNVKLVLIGEDMLNGSLQNQADQMGIKNNVLFLGERKDVSSLLTIADICVLPSLSEGMSNSILEYMAAAKPVIATNVGGNPELVKNEFNGLLVEKENVQQLKEALLKLLQDKEKCQTMGQNGLSMVKKEFTMEAMMAQYNRFFTEIVPVVLTDTHSCSSLKIDPRNDVIKVLHLVSSGGLYGAEQVMLTLAGCANGVIHVIGALNNQHNPHLEIIQEAKKRGLYTAIFESKGRFDFNTIQQVTNFVLNNNINIIHTHNSKANLIGAWAAHRSHRRWVSTIHGWIGTDAKLRFYESVDVFILKFADKIICVAESNYKKLLQLRFSPKRLTVIYNGIDLNRFSRGPCNIQLKQNWGISDNGTVITIVGRLAPEKGHEVLFKAMAQVIRQHLNVKLLVIGDGPLRNKLNEQIKDLNLSDHIIMTGPREDMPDIYRICDILVNASYTEGLPMTILEAMASKVAVIATSVGAVSQVIRSGKNGLLIKPKDSHGLAESLNQLIKDPHVRQQLTQEAYSNVNVFFSDKIMFDKYKQIYKELIL